jgi:hypothetical protein
MTANMDREEKREKKATNADARQKQEKIKAHSSCISCDTEVQIGMRINGVSTFPPRSAWKWTFFPIQVFDRMMMSTDVKPASDT